MSSIAAKSRPWGLDWTGATLNRLMGLAPVLVGVLLIELALSDGGQHLETLAWVETISLLSLAVIVWIGVTPPIAVSWALGGMIVAIVVSVVPSVRPEASVRELLQWLTYMGLFAVTAVTVSGRTALRRFVDAVVVIGGWLCLIALFLFWGANDPTMRWYSTFYWPNPFAGFLLLLLPIAFVRFVHAHGMRETVAHGALTLLLAVSMVLTYSRGAWLSMGLTVPLALLVIRPPSWRAVVGRIGVLTILASLAVSLLTRGTVLQASARGGFAQGGPSAILDDLSIQGRLEFWQSGIKIFRDNPLLGTGAGTFGAVHPVYQRDVRFYAKDAHNRYLQTAAELGLVGFAVLAAIVIAIAALWRQALVWTREGEAYPLIAGIGLGLAAFAAHSALDMDWLFPANPAMAFALVGVLAASRPTHQLTAERETSPRRSLGRVLLVGGLICAAGVAQAFQFAQRQFVAGNDLAQRRQWTDAVDRYRVATRWNPLSARYWGGLALASIHLTPPQGERAIRAMRRAIGIDRMDAAHPLELAELIMAQDGGAASATEAETLLRRALQLDPHNRPDAYRTLALLYVRQGRFEDASKTYADAITRYRGHDLGRGSLLYARLWPQVTALFLDAADMSARQGDLSRAGEILQQLLVEDPTAVPASLRLASVYLQQGRPSDARRVLEAAAARVPDNADIRAALDHLP